MSNTALDERSDPHVYNTLLWPPALADRLLLLLLCNYWIANKPRIGFFVILPDVSWGTGCRCYPFILGIFRHFPSALRFFPVSVAICFLVLLQSPCCCSRWRGGGVAWRGLLRVGQNKSGAPEAWEWRRETVSVRTKRCPGLTGTGHCRRKCRSGRVRPEANKEIMAPRCVCSRMEGGESAAVWEKRSRCVALLVNQGGQSVKTQQTAVGL